MPKPAKSRKSKSVQAASRQAKPAKAAATKGPRMPYDAIGLAVKRAMLNTRVPDGTGGTRLMNQADLAERAKVRPVAIRQWLTGGRAIRSHMAAACLDALGLEIVPRVA